MAAGERMASDGASIVSWSDPEETWHQLVACGDAPAAPTGLRVCGQHVECLSADMGFPSCSVQGCRHTWPFDDVQPRVPAIFDNLAVYAPLHTHGPASWGVWFHAERMTAYAEWIATVCGSSHAREDVFDIVARHAQFHHLVEAAITAFELTPACPVSRYAPLCAAGRALAHEPLEELLANAFAFRRALGFVGRRTLECLMDRVRATGAPGYAAFDVAMEPESFAAAEIELMRRRVVTDLDFLLPNEHGRAAEVPVYLWGSEAARRAVAPAARNAVLGPLIGRARYAGRAAGSVSPEARAEVAERYGILKALGEVDHLYAMLFDSLDFDTIAEVRTGLIALARGAPTMAELEPIVLEIGTFERAVRWETMEDALRRSRPAVGADAA